MATDYAFIRAYGKYIEARESFVDDQVRLARRQNVGEDVYTFDPETQTWKRFPDLEARAESGDEEVAEMVKKIRAIMR